jgi:hypothetical protein
MKKVMGWVGVSVLVLGLALLVVTPASTPTAANTSGTAVTAAAPAPERHPEIRKALEALRVARNRIKDAAHDFGGHCAEALERVDAAIYQLEICLQYDK